MTWRRPALPWFPGLIRIALLATALLAPYLATQSPTEGDITKRMEQFMPVIVFNPMEAGNILKAVQGELVGSHFA